MSNFSRTTRSMTRAKAAATAATSRTSLLAPLSVTSVALPDKPGATLTPLSPARHHLSSLSIVIPAPSTFDFSASLESAQRREEDLFRNSVPDASTSGEASSSGQTSAACSSPPAPAPASSPSLEAFPPASRLSRQQQYQNIKRMKKRRQQEANGLKTLRVKAVMKHLSPSLAGYEVDPHILPHSKPGWIGAAARRAEDRVYSVEEMLDLGFRYQAWDGSGYMTVATQDSRGFLHFVGRPEDPDGCDPEVTWAETTHRADSAMEAVKLDFDLRPGQKSRGNYPVVSVGMSFGGGPKEPYNVADSKPAERLLEDPDIKRITHFQSNVFATSAPKLYGHYHDIVAAVRKQNLGLNTNFPNSIFPTVAFNCGCDVVTHAHVDSRNVSYGLCAITALGSYDHTKGGHIYFWELKLIVEFPPGAMALIPSALLTHGNTAIQPGEHRASLTQYMAGALVRYVDYGFQAGTVLEEKDAGLKRRIDNEGEKRWKDGLQLYSKRQELKSDIEALFSLSTL